MSSFIFAKGNFKVHPSQTDIPSESELAVTQQPFLQARVTETNRYQAIPLRQDTPWARRHDPTVSNFCISTKDFTMNRSILTAVTLAVAALSTGHALAADVSGPKTRDQVRAELAEAQRTGNILADGETGQMLKDLYPHRYPAAAAPQAKTREQVRAELVEAQRNGDVLADGETGQKLRELNPSRYPAASVTQVTTREQVRAELAEAQRNGDVIADGETGQKLRELYPHRYPAAVMAQGKTREQVRAELVEAQRTGDIMAGDESGKKLNELYPSRYPAASSAN
jgi:hypothetical protein